MVKFVLTISTLSSILLTSLYRFVAVQMHAFNFVFVSLGGAAAES